VLDSDDAPIVGESITTTFWDRSTQRSETSLTDQAGQIHRTVHADEEIDLTVKVGDVYLDGEFRTTAQTEGQELLLQLPAFNSQLLANVLFADGSLGHYSSRSYLQTPITLQVTSGAAVELAVTVSGTRVIGFLEIAEVPSGNYRTTFTKDQTSFTMEGVLVADVEATYTFPATHDFIFQIVNEQGQAIPNAWIQAGETFQPGFNLVWAGQTDESGMSYFSRALTPEASVMVVSAPGYAPVELATPQSQGVTHITLNQQGRSTLQIDTAPLGLALAPGNAWILDQWGAANAPFQGLVYEDYEGHRLTLYSAPLESFHLSEINTNGTPTGKRILVPANGPPVRNDS
jgi:prepilin-type processing-associated H-X9-DG protein